MSAASPTSADDVPAVPPLPSLGELEPAVLQARSAAAEDGTWLILSALPSELKRTRSWLHEGRALPPFAPKRQLPPPFAGRLVGRNVVLASVGMGAMASETTPRLLEVLRGYLNDRIAGALIIGFGGGLDAALGVGDLAVAEVCIDVSGDQPAALEPDPTLLAVAAHTCDEAALTHRRTPIVTVSKVVESPDDKRALAAQDSLQRDGAGPAAVDMETTIIARTLNAARVPWTAVRAVFDTATHVMPRALAPMALLAGPPAFAMMTWILLTRPGLIPRLPALGRANALATRRLHRFVLSFLLFAPYRASADAPTSAPSTT